MVHVIMYQAVYYFRLDKIDITWLVFLTYHNLIFIQFTWFTWFSFDLLDFLDLLQPAHFFTFSLHNFPLSGFTNTRQNQLIQHS